MASAVASQSLHRLGYGRQSRSGGITNPLQSCAPSILRTQKSAKLLKGISKIKPGKWIKILQQFHHSTVNIPL